MLLAMLAAVAAMEMMPLMPVLVLVATGVLYRFGSLGLKRLVGGVCGCGSCHCVARLL